MLAPFVPTPALCITAALRLLQIQDSTRFYDIGGGDGRVSFNALIQSQSTCRCVEIDKQLCNTIEKSFKKFSRIHQLSDSDRSRLEILNCNIFDLDISDATHVYCYLTQSGVENIEHYLNQTPFKLGTKIVSCEYQIPKWKCQESETVFDLSLYLYEIGNHLE